MAVRELPATIPCTYDTVQDDFDAVELEVSGMHGMAPMASRVSILMNNLRPDTGFRC